MGRRNLIRTDLYYYHITTRCNNKEWFNLPLAQVWHFCKLSLAKAKSKHQGIVIAFVLMNNHYHLVIRTPQSNLDKFMFELNRGLSKYIRIATGRVNRIFGDRYKWSIILKDSYFLNCLRYVLQNPMRANISSFCQDYPYSSYYYFHRNTFFPFAKDEFVEILNDLGGQDYFCDWVNTTLTLEENDRLKFGINQRIFRHPDDLPTYLPDYF